MPREVLTSLPPSLRIRALATVCFQSPVFLGLSERKVGPGGWLDTLLYTSLGPGRLGWLVGFMHTRHNSTVALPLFRYALSCALGPRTRPVVRTFTQSILEFDRFINGTRHSSQPGTESFCQGVCLGRAGTWCCMGGAMCFSRPSKPSASCPHSCAFSFFTETKDGCGTTL